jgi:hypothetical protein
MTARKTKDKPATPVIEQPPEAQLPATIAPNDPSLPELAARINAEFGEVDAALVGALNHRVLAGKMLKSVREQLRQAATRMGGDGKRSSFDAWCKKNIKRSKADIYACLALVKSDDPAEQAAAVTRERTRAATGMAAARKWKQSVTLQTTPAPTPTAMPAIIDAEFTPVAIDPAAVVDWTNPPLLVITARKALQTLLSELHQISESNTVAGISNAYYATNKAIMAYLTTTHTKL